MSEWEEEIERVNHNLRQIRRELNDMSHAVARIEGKVEGMEKTLSWIIGLLCFFGSLITILALI